MKTTYTSKAATLFVKLPNGDLWRIRQFDSVKAAKAFALNEVDPHAEVATHFRIVTDKKTIDYIC